MQAEQSISMGQIGVADGQAVTQPLCLGLLSFCLSEAWSASPRAHCAWDRTGGRRCVGQVLVPTDPSKVLKQ